ncbi:hypothetical protein [Acinetobacter seifertii]|uniref:hypothetical protein n=1 Tax=Acinetobacter seifertii TaxID=1530123 RepID=UPI0012505D4F|nr:hypothetical protein [Acinetobacter seifertii]
MIHAFIIILVLFVIALIILWIMLDYHFIRLSHEIKAMQEKDIEIQLRPKSQLLLNQHIHKGPK